MIWTKRDEENQRQWRELRDYARQCRERIEQSKKEEPENDKNN